MTTTTRGQMRTTKPTMKESHRNLLIVAGFTVFALSIVASLILVFNSSLDLRETSPYSTDTLNTMWEEYGVILLLPIFTALVGGATAMINFFKKS